MERRRHPGKIPRISLLSVRATVVLLEPPGQGD
jgi:hypothetical protein